MSDWGNDRRYAEIAFAMEMGVIETFWASLQERVSVWLFSWLGLSVPVLLKSSLAREGFWSMVLRAVNTLLVFVSTVILARLLGADGYGKYAYAYSLIMLLSVPAQVGLPNLVLRETARGMAQQQPGLVKGMWWWAGRVMVVLSGMVVLGVGPFLLLWQGGVQSVQGRTLAWALTLIPLIALGNLLGSALRGLQHVVAGQLPEFIFRPGFFLLLLGSAAFLAGGNLSPVLAMLLYAVASLMAFLGGVRLLWRFTPRVVRRAQPVATSKVWALSTVLFGLLAGVRVVNSQSSIVILGIFESPDQIGFYRVAAQVAALASFGLQAISQVVAPRFADLYARGDKKHLQRLVTNSARVALAFNLAFTLLFMLFGRTFFTVIFGPKFAASYLPLIILLMGHVVNSANGAIGFVLNMTGHESETTRWVAVSAALNIVLSLLLIPVWGIYGAAVATALSMVVWNVLLWWRARKVLGINGFALA